MPHRSIFAPPLPSGSTQVPFADFPIPTTRDLFSPPPADCKKPPNRAKEVQAAIRAATSLSHEVPEHYRTTSSVLLPGFQPSAESTRKSCRFVEKRHKIARFDHITTNEALFTPPSERRAFSSMSGAAAVLQPLERVKPIHPPGAQRMLCDDANTEPAPFQSMQQLFEAKREKELAKMLHDGVAVRLPPFRPHQILANPLSFESTTDGRKTKVVISGRKDSPFSFATGRTNTSQSQRGGSDVEAGLLSSYQAQFQPKKAEPVGRVVHTIAFLRKQQGSAAAAPEVDDHDEHAPRYFMTTNQELMYKFARGWSNGGKSSEAAATVAQTTGTSSPAS